MKLDSFPGAGQYIEGKGVAETPNEVISKMAKYKCTVCGAAKDEFEEVYP